MLFMTTNNDKYVKYARNLIKDTYLNWGNSQLRPLPFLFSVSGGCPSLLAVSRYPLSSGAGRLEKTPGSC